MPSSLLEQAGFWEDPLEGIEFDTGTRGFILEGEWPY
jgi:hypothetical protein